MSNYILLSVSRSAKKQHYTPIISERVHRGKIANDGIESL